MFRKNTAFKVECLESGLLSAGRNVTSGYAHATSRYADGITRYSVRASAGAPAHFYPWWSAERSVILLPKSLRKEAVVSFMGRRQFIAFQTISATACSATNSAVRLAAVTLKVRTVVGGADSLHMPVLIFYFD